MKLAKLSLAAIMTVGAMSAVNAGSLEEAIKGVNLSGNARYRFEDGTEAAKHKNSFRVLLDFKTPVIEDVALSSRLHANRGHAADKTSKDGNSALTLERLFVTYTPVEGLAAVAGKQYIGTPIDDSVGTGVKVLYTLPAGLTLAAAYFDDVTGNEGVDNLYAAGAVFSSDMFGVRAWYANAAILNTNTNNTGSFIFTEATAGFEGINGTLQYATADRDWQANKRDTIRVGVDGAFDAFNFKLGYIMNDKNGGDVSLDGSDKGDNDLLYAGWKIGTMAADTNYIYAGVGAKFGKFGASLNYVDADLPTGATGSEDEINANISYEMTSKLSTAVKYSTMSRTGNTSDMKNFRFQAQYSF